MTAAKRRFCSHIFKLQKLCRAGCARCQQLPCCGLCPLPATAVCIMTNPCPHRSEGHGFCVSILFQLIRNSRCDAHRFKASKLTKFSPSVKTCGFATFLVRGRQGYDHLFSWLHLMVRTEDPAVQGFGSAVLESVGFVPAGRGLQAAVPRLNLRLSRRQSAKCRPANL